MTAARKPGRPKGTTRPRGTIPREIEETLVQTHVRQHAFGPNAAHAERELARLHAEEQRVRVEQAVRLRSRIGAFDGHTLRDLDEVLEAEVNAGEMTAAAAQWYRDAILGGG